MKAFSQHSLSRRTLLGAGIAAGALSACPAFADLRIEITGVGANQIPIAIRRLRWRLPLRRILLRSSQQILSGPVLFAGSR